MDRHISSSLGLPMSTQDDEITALINTSNTDNRESTFNLHIRLWRMLSFILNSVYKTEKTRLGPFLGITRRIIRRMAEHAEEIEKMVEVDLQGSMENVRQDTRQIILLYHQCVIIATRPLLLSVLKERLEKLGSAREEWQIFLALPKSLISIGIKSAVKILQILCDKNSFLETFLPFHLEFTYSAAVYLAIAHTLFQPAVDAEIHSQWAHSILDEIVRGGNKVAGARKEELNRIQILLRELAKYGVGEDLQLTEPPDQRTSESGPMSSFADQRQGEQYEVEHLESTEEDSRQQLPVAGSSSYHDYDDIIGISSDEFLSVMNEIPYAGLPLGFSSAGNGLLLQDRNILDLFE